MYISFMFCSTVLILFLFYCYKQFSCLYEAFSCDLSIIWLVLQLLCLCWVQWYCTEYASPIFVCRIYNNFLCIEQYIMNIYFLVLFWHFVSITAMFFVCNATLFFPVSLNRSDNILWNNEYKAPIVCPVKGGGNYLRQFDMFLLLMSTYFVENEDLNLLQREENNSVCVFTTTCNIDFHIWI